MRFAEFLAYAMEQTKLTNYKLAKLVGVSQTTVSNWLNGLTEPRNTMRDKVFALFGVDEQETKNGVPEIRYKEKKLPSNIGEQPMGDSELFDFLDMLRNRPECRMLFSVTKNATKEDVEKAVAIIEALRKTEGR